MEVFDRLNTLAGSGDLSDFYLGVCSPVEVEHVLQDLIEAINMLLDSTTTLDLTQSNTSLFLHSSLPILMELLLRKKSRR